MGSDEQSLFLDGFLFLTGDFAFAVVGVVANEEIWGRYTSIHQN